MNYALLIYQAEELAERRSEAETEQMLQEHRELQERSKSAGAFVLAEELMPSHAATTVRSRAGKVSIMDGPFAETKEQFIGLYVVSCKDLDEAIEYAKLIPDVRTGSIEVRPIAYHEVGETSDA